MSNKIFSTFISYRKFLDRNFVAVIACLTLITLLLYTSTYVWVFYFLPDDYLQGNLVKIMYIHVPCAWLSLMTYFLLGVVSILYLVYNSEVFNIIAGVVLSISLNTSAITLVTGAIWGKTAWGTWWIWDPRLTAVFIQFCMLSVCYIMRNMQAQNNRALDKSVALLIVVGMINLPIIKFAVDSWNSIHQNSSVFRFDGIKIHKTLFSPLIVSFISISFFYFTVGLTAMQNALTKIRSHRK